MLVLLSRWPSRQSGEHTADRQSPESLAIIIAAYNEESRIRDKLENTLRLERTAHDLEIIVASDGSTDGTHDVVRQYAAQGVQLVVSPGRQGKEAAQSAAIETTKCEILVFTDVATTLDEQALVNVARNFEDPTIGAVSSTDKFIADDGEVVGEGFYVRYEMWLRQLESRVNTLVGSKWLVLCRQTQRMRGLGYQVPSDFGTAINCVRRGLRAISDPALIGIYRGH